METELNNSANDEIQKLRELLQIKELELETARRDMAWMRAQLEQSSGAV